MLDLGPTPCRMDGVSLSVLCPKRSHRWWNTCFILSLFPSAICHWLWTCVHFLLFNSGDQHCRSWPGKRDLAFGFHSVAVADEFGRKWYVADSLLLPWGVFSPTLWRRMAISTSWRSDGQVVEFLKQQGAFDGEVCIWIADLHRLHQLASLEQKRLQDEVSRTSCVPTSPNGAYHNPVRRICEHVDKISVSGIDPRLLVEWPMSHWRCVLMKEFVTLVVLRWETRECSVISSSVSCQLCNRTCFMSHPRHQWRPVCVIMCSSVTSWSGLNLCCSLCLC